MYVTKVWGFDNPCGPLVFGLVGACNSAARRLLAGDRVILVGTKADDTQSEDRNRVLGMMEPSTVVIASSDFPYPNPNDQRLFKEDGSYRWPFGLLNLKAWMFDAGLFLDDVAENAGNRFGSAAAAGIVLLSAEEEERVLAHPHHEIQLLKPSISAERKLYGEEAAKRRGAPPPTEGVRRGVMHMRQAVAYTYWFQLVLGGKIVGHKIGWAFDWRQRLQQFRSVSLHKLGGLEYRPYRSQQFDTARLAFHAEQGILRVLDAKRHPSNREVITGIMKADIEAEWDRVVTAIMLNVAANP